MHGLPGKVAIVTGAGSGIGEACVRRLATEGVRVVVADINEAAANKVAAGIEAQGRSAIAIAVDVSIEEQVDRLVAETVRQYGQLDIMHNNAAATGPDVIGRDFDIASADSALWDKTMAVNARGVMLGCKYALRAMRPRKSGVIINTSSMNSVFGDLSRSAYAASKGAVDSITQHIATRYGKEGIRCVGVSPGVIFTPAAFTILSEEERTRFTRHNLLPRAGAPEDIAGAVAYLASDDASFITGQTISVDGGMTCHAPWFADAFAAEQQSNR